MYALDIKNLSKTYNKGVQALKGVSLTVESGDFFALLGPNGAGKSTLIGIITSLIRKTSGNVKIFGFDIDTHFSKAKSLLGVVPQEFNFNEFRKVRDVLLCQAGFYGIPYHDAKKQVDKYLSLSELTEKSQVMTRTLSGGMKRRLMIARAMLHEPKLLILDEPTAGVDIDIRRSMWQFMQEINTAGTSIILTTHYLEEAENLCRNVAIINHGRIIENSGLPALLRQLDRECFVLYLQTPLSHLPKLPVAYEISQVDDTTLEVDVSKEGNVTELIELLAKETIQVNSMRNKSNRLEELFLRLTHEGDLL